MRTRIRTDDAIKRDLEMAADPDTHFHDLIKLSKSKDVNVQRAVAENPSAAIDENGEVDGTVLWWLARHFPDEVARSPAFALFGLELKDTQMFQVAQMVAWKAKDPQSLALVCQEFRQDEHVRRYVADNRNAPKDVLRVLGNVKTEPDEWVRRNVASNENSPEDTLRILGNVATEPSATVRISVARNKKTPEHVLVVLGNANTEPSELVRKFVASNEKSTEDTLSFLSNESTEPDESVRQAAISSMIQRRIR